MIINEVQNAFLISESVAPVRLSSCEERAAAGKAKNFPMITSCDQDGMFQEVQCLASFCWCSQPNGKHLPNTFFDKIDKDSPECAREVGKSSISSSSKAMPITLTSKLIANVIQ